MTTGARPITSKAPSPKMRGGVVKRGTTWSYVVRERDPKTGQTKPRWKGGYRTQKEAAAARAEAISAQAKGTYVPPQNLTVGDWLDTWLDGHSLELKRSTVESYRANIDRYLRRELGHERVQGLSPSRLTVVFKNLHEHGGRNGKPLSARTVEYCRAILRRSLNDAVIERVIAVNPVIGTKRPRPTKAQHRTWTAAQVTSFLTATVEKPEPLPEDADHRARLAHGRVASARVFRERLGAFFAFSVATGMRRGEVCALRWADVDLTTGVVSVERGVTVIAGERTYDTPKNHERRKVKLDVESLAELKAHRRAQTKNRLAWGAAWKDTEGLVFTLEDGTPLRPDYVSKAFPAAQHDLDLPRLTLHELRHTHATLLLRDRVPVHIVAKRLGHKDPSVTLNIYADVIPQDDGEAADVYGRLVHRRNA